MIRRKIGRDWGKKYSQGIRDGEWRGSQLKLQKKKNIKTKNKYK
jgi:hypothetical protein